MGEVYRARDIKLDFPIGINAGGCRQDNVTPDGRFIIIGRSQESANAPAV